MSHFPARCEVRRGYNEDSFFRRSFFSSLSVTAASKQTDHSIVRRILPGFELAGGHGTVLFAALVHQNTALVSETSRW